MSKEERIQQLRDYRETLQQSLVNGTPYLSQNVAFCSGEEATQAEIKIIDNFLALNERWTLIETTDTEALLAAGCQLAAGYSYPVDDEDLYDHAPDTQGWVYEDRKLLTVDYPAKAGVKFYIVLNTPDLAWGEPIEGFIFVGGIYKNEQQKIEIRPYPNRRAPFAVVDTEYAGSDSLGVEWRGMLSVFRRLDQAADFAWQQVGIKEFRSTANAVDYLF